MLLIMYDVISVTYETIKVKKGFSNLVPSGKNTDSNLTGNFTGSRGEG
jgi:hypothetical protein